MSRRNYTAELLYNMYKFESNLALFSFFMPILEELQRVNKAFETENADPCKLFTGLSTLISFLVSKVLMPRSNIDPLSMSIDNYLAPKPYLGFGFESKIRETRERNSISEQVEHDHR